MEEVTGVNSAYGTASLRVVHDNTHQAARSHRLDPQRVALLP